MGIELSRPYRDFWLCGCCLDRHSKATSRDDLQVIEKKAYYDLYQQLDDLHIKYDKAIERIKELEATS